MLSVVTKNTGLIRLEDVVAPQTVPNGFYVAQGATAAIPRVLDQIVDLFHQEFDMNAAEINNQTHVGRLFWIDSGNSFDAYHVARSAARKGLDPKRVLRAIQVARPFTAYQFQQMLEKIPQPAMGTSSAPINWTPLVIVSDLMGLFYDSEIPEHDAHRSFHRFVSGLMHLQDRAVILGLLHDEAVPPSRKAFLPRIMNMAKPVLSTPKINIGHLPPRFVPNYLDVATRMAANG